MQMDLLKEKFNILSAAPAKGVVEAISADSSEIREILIFLKNTPEFDFDMLYCISASDFVEFFRLDYVLCSTKLGTNLVVSVKLSKNAAIIQSVRDIYPSADWEEREIFDLLGVNFAGRAALERLFMPKGWVGHPLRKDYVQEDKRLAWNNG